MPLEMEVNVNFQAQSGCFMLFDKYVDSQDDRPLFVSSRYLRNNYISSENRRHLLPNDAPHSHEFLGRQNNIYSFKFNMIQPTNLFGTGYARSICKEKVFSQSPGMVG
jgi:hypothetical protein